MVELVLQLPPLQRLVIAVGKSCHARGGDMWEPRPRRTPLGLSAAVGRHFRLLFTELHDRILADADSSQQDSAVNYLVARPYDR